MTESCKIRLCKANFIASLEPHRIVLLVFALRKYGDLETFFVIIGLFAHIDKMKSPCSSLNVSETKKEPYVIPISIGIILYH